MNEAEEKVNGQFNALSRYLESLDKLDADLKADLSEFMKSEVTTQREAVK